MKTDITLKGAGTGHTGIESKRGIAFGTVLTAVRGIIEFAHITVDMIIIVTLVWRTGAQRTRGFTIIYSAYRAMRAAIVNTIRFT